MPVSNDDGKEAYHWFGNAFMLVRTGETVNGRPLIDHFACNLADWDPDRVSAALKKRGLEAQADSAGKSIMTKDLNGYPLQLCSKDLAKRP